MFTLKHNPEGKIWLIETLKPLLGLLTYVPSVIFLLFGYPIFIAHPDVLTYLLISVLSGIGLTLLCYWIDCSRGIYDAKWADEEYRKSFKPGVGS
jgi:hypothetical protein